MVITPRYEQIKNFTIIKRDGREEPFYLDKLIKVITWSCEEIKNSEVFIESLLNELSLKIVDKMRIQDLYDELINIASSKISALYPIWDSIAKYLYLLKIYKEDFNLKRIGTYPSFNKFLQRGIKRDIYDKNIINSFTEDEIDEISTYIDPNRDLLFNYKGLRLFFDKYCKSFNGKLKNKKLELPQITYMAAAIHSHYNEPHETNLEVKQRLKNIKRTYDLLSTHKITFSTPRISFGLVPRPQFASCVLMTPGDDTLSLNTVDSWAALYSKYMGGIAVDFSYIRTRGSIIKANNGLSDGPIPFVKRMEQTISSFNQSGKRNGSVIIYFPWWNMDVEDLIMLKNAGGAEENRARKCKYSIKINRLLLDRADKDEYITLFDPKETWILNEINGKEFEKKYIEFENNANIKSKKIKARKLIELLFRVRVETGNLYVAFMDNINEQELTGRFITMSNLCCEITVPSRKPEVVSEKYYKNKDGKYEVHIVRDNGEIGLCNLSSIDSHKWYNLSDDEKDKLVYTLLKGMDNAIDSQFYPVSEAEWTNKAYRPIGIGITNFANLAASQKIKYSDDNILQFMNDLMDDIYYRVYKFSVELSKERGSFDNFRKSVWANGLTPFHLSIFRKNNPFNLKFNEEKWDNLGKEISRYGVRFSLHAAIPPSSTSGKVTNATEACEPIFDLFYLETGTYNLPTVVSGIKEYGAYYERCWDIDPKRILELAAVRQIYLDQSQSFNQYYKKAESLSDLYEDLRYAESLGIKSLYYFKQPKSQAELECASCSV